MLYKMDEQKIEHLEETNVNQGQQLNTNKMKRQKSIFGRLGRIRKSQTEYGELFSKLNCIIEQLRDKYPPMESQQFGTDDNESIEDVDSTIDHSSGASTSSEIINSQNSNSSGLSSSQFNKSTNKRKRKFVKRRLSQEESDFIDIDAEIDSQEYPKRVHNNSIDGTKDEVIIGRNGTTIDYYDFKVISWNTAAMATRCLLSLVFSSDILATHTLTGKPSPAFYGRERPPKMQLDPLKTADIIYCVKSKCGSGNEREIRSAITTKCADTAKKYRRRMLKEKKSQ